MILDNKFTFKQHLCLVSFSVAQKNLLLKQQLCSVSSSVAQKIGLLRKAFKIFLGGGISEVWKWFNFSILPYLGYCSPVWSHLRLLDSNLSAIRFLILLVLFSDTDTQ